MKQEIRKKARFTAHALERAAEIGLSVSDLISAYYRASQNDLSEKMKAYKFKRYGMQSLADKYLWDSQSEILFTVSAPDENKVQVLTITKGRGNLF